MNDFLLQNLEKYSLKKASFFALYEIYDTINSN